VDEWSVLQRAALKHWRGLDQPLSDQFLSVNRDLLHSLVSLHEYLDRPASTEQPRDHILHNPDTMPMLCDLDHGASANAEKLFKIVALSPAQKKFVKVSIGAGAKIKDTQLAICVFKQHSTDPVCVEGDSQGGGGVVDLLDNVWDPFEFEASLKLWHHSTLQYFWSMSSMPDISPTELRRAVTLLVESNAYPHEDSPVVRVNLQRDPALAHTFMALMGKGFVSCEYPTAHMLTVRMTLNGLSLALFPVWTLSQPELVLPISDDCVPLQDLSSYQLMRILHDKGWRWDMWIPTKRRSKAQRQALPVAYELGAEKVWFSSTTRVSKYYLVCLLMAEERRIKLTCGCPCRSVNVITASVELLMVRFM